MNKNEEIAKLKIALMQKIKSENDSRYANLSPDEIIKTIFNSSDNGKYSLWIIREYLKGNTQKFEDMGRVKQALILFKNNLSKFSEQEKQLNKLSFQELEALVEPYQDVLTQNEIKRMNKEKIWCEIDVIYEGVEGKIYIPKTEQAAIFLGQGTRWCTAATNNNMFGHYNKQGPLYVLITPEKDENGREIKYQLHFETGQFMNMEDIPIDIKNTKTNNLLDILYNEFGKYTVVEKINKLISNDLFFNLFSNKKEFDIIKEKILIEKLKLCQNDHRFFKILKEFPSDFIEKNICEDMYRKILVSNPTCVMHLPEKFQTEENYMKALDKNVHFFEHFPNKFKNYELCKEIVSKNGFLLKYVPEHLKTKEICRIAVENSGCSLLFVPEKLKDESICKLALKSDSHAFKCVPKEFITDDFIKEVIAKNVGALDFVDHEKISEKLCDLVTQNNPRALRYIPDKFKTKKMCEEAFKKDIHTFIDIPQNFVTENMILTVLDIVKKYGYFLEYIPEKYKTTELVLDAVKQNGNAIQCVPEELITEELCEIAALQTDMALRYIPKCFFTEKFLEKLLRSDIKYLEFIPTEFKNEKMYQIAIESSLKNKQKNILTLIPEEYITYELVDAFIDGATAKSLSFAKSKNIKLQEMLVEIILKKNDLNYSVEEALKMLFSLEENDFQQKFKHMKQSLSFIYMKLVVDELLNELKNEDKLFFSK